jgi:tetratricopeptide (TPR) repeat protein
LTLRLFVLLAFAGAACLGGPQRAPDSERHAAEASAKAQAPLPASLQRRVDELHAGGDARSTLAELRAYLRDHPTSAAGWHALAQCLLDPDLPSALGDTAGAVEAARRAAEHAAGPASEQLVTLGAAELRSGDREGALRAFERALADDPGYALDGRAELEELVHELRAKR